MPIDTENTERRVPPMTFGQKLRLGWSITMILGAGFFIYEVCKMNYNIIRGRGPAGEYMIPKESEPVKMGYVSPSKLEIKLEDLDGDQKMETLLKYNGTNYLLKIDTLGMPKVQAYEVKLEEAVSK